MFIFRIGASIRHEKICRMHSHWNSVVLSWQIPNWALFQCNHTVLPVQEFPWKVMPVFHWPAMPRRSYGVRKNEQIRGKIAETVWWNISGATISHVLRINCVSMIWVTHMWRIWRMNGDATAYDVAYENLTIEYARRKWRMHSVHPTYARRSTRFYGVWRAYVRRMGCVHAEPINTPHYIWAANVTFKCPCSWIHMYLNIQFHLSNFISHVYHRHDMSW